MYSTRYTCSIYIIIMELQGECGVVHDICWGTGVILQDGCDTAILAWHYRVSVVQYT